MAANYEYKCVYIPDAFQAKGSQHYEESIEFNQSLINDEASNGWKYVRVDIISSYRAGCLSILLKRKPIDIRLVIFEREVRG